MLSSNDATQRAQVRRIDPRGDRRRLVVPPARPITAVTPTLNLCSDSLGIYQLSAALEAAGLETFDPEEIDLAFDDHGQGLEEAWLKVASKYRERVDRELRRRDLGGPELGGWIQLMGPGGFASEHPTWQQLLYADHSHAGMTPLAIIGGTSLGLCLARQADASPDDFTRVELGAAGW